MYCVIWTNVEDYVINQDVDSPYYNDGIVLFY